MTLGIFFVVVVGLLFLLFVYAVAKGFVGEFFIVVGVSIASICGLIGLGCLWLFGILMSLSPLIVLVAIVLLMIKCIF